MVAGVGRRIEDLRASEKTLRVSSFGLMEDWVVVIGSPGDATTSPGCLMEVVTSIPGIIEDTSEASSATNNTLSFGLQSDTSEMIAASSASVSDFHSLEPNAATCSIPSNELLPEISALTRQELHSLKRTLQAQLDAEKKMLRLQE